MTTFFFSTASNLQDFTYGSNMKHTVHDSLTHTLSRLATTLITLNVISYIVITGI